MTRHLSLCLSGLLTAAACGPVQSTAQLVDADRQLRAAREAGAESRAPYEWTAATLYLQKAREEVGHSSYEIAVQFARKAAQYAIEARERADAASPTPETQSPEEDAKSPE